MTNPSQKSDVPTFGGVDTSRFVYIREILGREVAEEAAAQGITVDPNATLFAVHDADGERLAVLDDRAAAEEAARGHELTPVSLH